MFSLTSRAGMGWGWGIGIRAFIHIFSHAWSSLLFLPYFDYMWKRNFITYWLSVEVTLMKLTCLEILINVGLVECGAVSKSVVVAALAPAQKAWQRPLGLVWMSRCRIVSNAFSPSIEVTAWLFFFLSCGELCWLIFKCYVKLEFFRQLYVVKIYFLLVAWFNFY